MLHVLGTDTYAFPDRVNLYLAGIILHELFPHLRETAAEDMEGELSADVRRRNAGNAAGPAYSKLFLDEVSDGEQ